MSNITKTYEDEQADLFLETKTKIVNNVFELGKILAETKEQLGHGNFAKWIKDSRVSMTPRNCQRYMKVYETFQMRHGMSLLSDLSLNNLYDLAQLPQEEREQMIESSETSKELVKKLKEYKKQQKEEKDKKQEVENIEEIEETQEEQPYQQSNNYNESPKDSIKIFKENITEYFKSEEFKNSNEIEQQEIIEELKNLIEEIQQEINLPIVMQQKEDIVIEDIDYEVEKTPEEIERDKENERILRSFKKSNRKGCF